MDNFWMGIAAAALIVSTAGITYKLTARSMRSGGDTRVAQTIPSTGVERVGNASPSGSISAAPQPVGASATGESVETPGASRLTQNGTQRTSVPARLVGRDLQSSSTSSEVVYGKEIAMLQKIVSQRKTQLDSSTVAIIEKNLEIIDAAIAQSKAALAKDPASLLLSEQLTHALDKKVELLRTAALLPAST